jgi:hypothetical protein
MMDLGLGRFFEMFEDRFGRRATTVLLALVGLAIASLSVGLVWEHIISPIFGIVANFPHITTEWMYVSQREILIDTALIAWVALLYYSIRNIWRLKMAQQRWDIENALSAQFEARINRLEEAVTELSKDPPN